MMKTIVLVAFFTICYVVCMDLVNKYMSNIQFENVSSTSVAENNSSVFSISISGEVVNPGTYTVSRGDNLGYLISLAGGLKENADITCFNSGAILDKELESYYIPSTSLDENNKSTKISLNTASALVLDQQLPGIGTVYSKRIIEYRTKTGGFKCVDELRNVSGIKESAFNVLKDLVCL